MNKNMTLKEILDSIKDKQIVLAKKIFNITTKEQIVPVRKIIKTINSCETQEQLKNCQSLVKNYIQIAKKNKVVNYHELEDRLNEELLERYEAIKLIDDFYLKI
jgi:hypothetical protein